MKLLHAALAAMLLSGCATAQGMPGMGGHDTGGGGMGGGGMGGGMGAHHGGAQICHFVGSGHHMEGTLAFLKAELKISAPQSAAWDAFAAAFASARPDSHGGMKHKGGTHGEGKAHDEAGALTDRMAHHEHMMEMHLSQMKKVHAAIAALYATLGEHEKHLADELVPAFMMCRMHG